MSQVIYERVRSECDTQHVRALGKIFEAGGQTVKNREMRSLAQKGNQAKFLHRIMGIQRSPVVYNLQHLREYNSCRIWASQSRRPPYVADMEGSARIEGAAASMHESYVDGHGHKVAKDAVFTVIIFDEAPRYWEVQSKSENKQHVHKQYSSWNHAHEPDLRWHAKSNPRTRPDNEREGLV